MVWGSGTWRRSPRLGPNPEPCLPQVEKNPFTLGDGSCPEKADELRAFGRKLQQVGHLCIPIAASGAGPLQEGG